MVTPTKKLSCKSKRIRIYSISADMSALMTARLHVQRVLHGAFSEAANARNPGWDQ